jgi:hypothetical protein
LVAEGSLVEVVAYYAQREYDNGEEVATVAALATKELGEDLVVIFYASWLGEAG